MTVIRWAQQNHRECLCPASAHPAAGIGCSGFQHHSHRKTYKETNIDTENLRHLELLYEDDDNEKVRDTMPSFLRIE